MLVNILYILGVYISKSKWCYNGKPSASEYEPPPLKLGEEEGGEAGEFESGTFSRAKLF